MKDLFEYSTPELVRMLGTRFKEYRMRFNVNSQEENYNSIAEQFKVGLKNVVELTTARTSLLQAEQEMLESKYTTVLNTQLLKFYSGENINI